jgi:hypothetical protein
MATSRSAKNFMERIGIIPTRRGPVPRLDLSANLAHSLPLQKPLPSGESLLNSGQQGVPPPDRGLTTEWPPSG